jgi:hypothetical protein
MEPKYPATVSFPGLDTWAITTVLGKPIGIVETPTTNPDYIVKILRRTTADLHRDPPFQGSNPMAPYALVEGGDFDRVGESGRPPRLVPAGTVREWCKQFEVPLVSAGPLDRYILCDLGDVHRKSLIVLAWGPMR